MTAAGTAPLAVETDGVGVRVLTFTLAERGNTWGPDLEDAYFDALEAADRDPGVRAVVVTGAGRTFCPGMDPDVLGHTASGGAYHPNRRTQTLPTTLQKPLIAAVNGACAGIGLVQALFCDRRITHAGAKFSTAFAKRGLPAEDGVAWVLSRLAGPSVAFDLLATGRVFAGDEAAALGVVDQLVEADGVLPAAVEYARQLATTVSPAAIAMIKKQVWQDLGSTLEQARLHARHLLSVAKLHGDFQEGVAAFREGRPPAFGPFDGINL